MLRARLSCRRLLALAAIAACTWSCHAGPGPPPLPPGADPAFDRHLAELDTRYRFLFAGTSRIFAARMAGAEETLLLDLAKVEGSTNVSISGDPRLSPDRRWLLVSYHGDEMDPAGRRLLVLDVHSREVRPVRLPEDQDYEFDIGCYGDDELCHWIAPDRFVISYSYYPPGGGERKKFFAYDLADLSVWRELTFADVDPLISRWREGPKPKGPRQVVVDSYHNAEPLFDFEDQASHWDVVVDGHLARRTWNEVSALRWDEELALYTWHEYDARAGTSFVMDEAGRYRPWHRGRWIAKLPRT